MLKMIWLSKPERFILRELLTDARNDLNPKGAEWEQRMREQMKQLKKKLK